jgi:uncharacterized protein (TIGR02598 family)
MGQHNFRRPGRLSGPRAFSLIEVALALGIVAFCGVALLGLMPLALGNARASKEDTRVAHLLQTLVANLHTRRGVITGPNAAEDFVSIDPVPPHQIEVSYSLEGKVLAAQRGADSFFAVTLRFKPAPPSVPKGWQVDFEIASPSGATTAAALLAPQ